MSVTVSLCSEKKEDLERFLSLFYNTSFDIQGASIWEKKYANPIELAEIIGAFIDNSENFQLNMWIHLDKNIFVHITDGNADDIIKYLYERFPY